jgi:hypothetical protein
VEEREGERGKEIGMEVVDVSNNNVEIKLRKWYACNMREVAIGPRGASLCCYARAPRA